MKIELIQKIKETSDLYSRVVSEASDGVYLYGAGFVGRWSIDYLEAMNIPVLGFIDSDESRWGSNFEGKNIYSPSDKLIKSAKTIIISSRHAVPDITASLCHLSATLMSIDAFVVHHQGKESIQEVELLFANDNTSLETFYAVLLSMLEGKTAVLGPYTNSNAFFDHFGFFNRSSEVFVDAGAYVGDTVERFIWSTNGVFSKIHAFEPGKIQFNAMEERVKRLISEWALKPNTIQLINMGLSSGSFTTYLSDTPNLIQTRLQKNYVSNSENVQNKTKIETISIDEYLSGEKLTFLKVDVEGSETELIQGAANSIVKFRPRIALSVYHFPTDIFTLPTLCKNKNKDYRFTLGHHSSQLMDTVLYCRDKND